MCLTSQDVQEGEESAACALRFGALDAAAAGAFGQLEVIDQLKVFDQL